MIRPAPPISLPVTLLAAAALLLTAGCSGQKENDGVSTLPEIPFAHFADNIMSTTIEVTLPDDSRSSAHADTVFALFRAVDASMSEWKASSPLSEVNRLAGNGEWVPVPDDLGEVIQKGIDIGDATEGAFDITWASLWGLWNFKSANPSLPDPSEISRRAALVDYKSVELAEDRGGARLARPGMMIGLGGIAKGYALDLSASALRRLGCTDFLLSAGGQIYAAGRRGERMWRVGIRDPRGDREDYFALFEAEDVSVSTSGDYENFFELHGSRYHHILDPKTGMPSQGLRGVTVIATDATTADAYSTALMILGRDRGLDLIESMAGAEAVVIDSAGSVYSTSGAGEGLTIRHPPKKRAASDRSGH